VAHELNNLLTVIQINTEFLLDSTSENRRVLRNWTDPARIKASFHSCPFAARIVETGVFHKLRAVSAKILRMRTANVEITGRGGRTSHPARRNDPARRSEAQFAILQERFSCRRDTGCSKLRWCDPLSFAAGHVGGIDLVLTDVAMPNLGRRGMVEELKELSPGMRVLFMSGYPKEEVFPDRRQRKNTPVSLRSRSRAKRCFRKCGSALGYQYGSVTLRRADWCSWGTSGGVAARPSTFGQYATVLLGSFAAGLTKILEMRRRPGDDQKVDQRR